MTNHHYIHNTKVHCYQNTNYRYVVAIAIFYLFIYSFLLYGFHLHGQEYSQEKYNLWWAVHKRFITVQKRFIKGHKVSYRIF